MIHITKLRKVYRTNEVETTALNDVSFDMEEGEFVSVMGPSGCGKSTLLNLIGLIDAPSGGEYFFLDSEVSALSERKRAGIRKGTIGFVFQSFNLIDDLTVRENIELPLLYLKTPSAKRRAAAGEIMERMRLTARRNHFPQQLSGGQQQRVAVARAIITSPRLILADEPTGNLDSRHGDEVMQLLTDQNAAGTSILMVTHSASYAEYAHRCVHLFDGKIVSEDVGRIAHD
jgi:putative ABC transport system ATP-binding protein